MDQTYYSSLEDQQAGERRFNLEQATAACLEEGVAAFVEKRRPDFVKAKRQA